MNLRRRAPLLLFILAVYLGVAGALWTWCAPSGPSPSDTGGTGTAGACETTAAAAVHPVDTAARTRVDPSGPLHVVRVEDRVSGERLPGASVTWREDPPPERMATHAGRAAEVALAEQQGATLVADEQGLVRVPATNPVLLVGRLGDRYGDVVIPRLAEPAADAPVHRLRLDRDLTLRIAVLDHRTAPAPGVAIEILPPDEAVRGGDPLTLPADDQGRVLVAHWQDLARERMWVRGVVERLLVRGRIPGVVGQGVAFDPTDPPAELVLRLPATGRIAVQALEGTRPLPRCDLTLQVVPDDEQHGGVVPEVLGTREWTVPTSADGRAVFERVVLGMRFRAQLRAGAVKASEVFWGPQSADQEVAAMLRAVAESCVLTGRALDPDRAPLGDAGLRLVYATEAGSGSRLVSTDGNGRFEVNLGHASSQHTLKSAEFSLAEHRSADAAGLGLAHRLAPRPLQPGVFDLGDLVLDGAAELASGRILPAGASTAAIELVVERRCERQGQVCWEPDPLAVVAFPGADRFEVRGQPRSELYRLRLVSRNCLPIDPIEFGRGARDLAIDLQPGGDLRAALRVAPELRSEDFAVLLRPVDVAASAATLEAAADRLHAEIEAAAGELLCTWGALWPGSYAVEVRSVGSDALLAATPVRVEAAARTVADIDLRRLHVMRLHVAGNDQEVVPDGPWNLVLADNEQPGGAPARIQLRRGIARIASGRPFADVQVLAEGFLPQRLRAVPGDNRVILDTLPSVSIRVQSEPVQRRLAIKLERLGATGSWPAPDAAALTIATDLVEADRTSTAAVRLPIGGRYRVVVFEQAEDRWVRVDDVVPDVIVVAATTVAQSFDVRIAR